MKKLLTTLAGLLMLFTLAACNEADTVSHNISQAADQFEVLRRVVFYNGITDSYMLSVEGYCSLGNDRTSEEISITCEVGPGEFKKHFLGLSDNVTYFLEQLESEGVSRTHYRVIFRPTEIVPDVEIDLD